jgi:hypothetical protein
MKRNTPSNKNTLIQIIKNNGSCLNVFCGDCPFKSAKCLDMCGTETNSNRYERAISLYIKWYGVEDLVEVLL